MNDEPKNELSVQQKAPIAVNSRGVQLRSMEDAWRFSQAVVQSGLAPNSFRTPQQVLIAIQYGAEVGFPPMQALQSIAVINGRPCLWGDALPALVRGGGQCEYIKEWFEGEGDDYGAVCETKRRDETEPCRRKFTLADAKRAGLLGKKGPWQDYRDRMLSMRARSWCLRDSYAECLRGIQVREEVEDYADDAIPGEVVERPAVGGLLDDLEIPDATDYGDSFDALAEQIDALTGDADELSRLRDDIRAAASDGGLTTAGRDELMRRLSSAPASA